MHESGDENGLQLFYIFIYFVSDIFWETLNISISYPVVNRIKKLSSYSTSWGQSSSKRKLVILCIKYFHASGNWLVILLIPVGNVKYNWTKRSEIFPGSKKRSHTLRPSVYIHKWNGCMNLKMINGTCSTPSTGRVRHVGHTAEIQEKLSSAQWLPASQGEW